MPKKEDISGILNSKIGSFTILEDVGVKKNSRFVLCRCDCGVTKEVRLSDIKNGSSNNCGCKRKRMMSVKNITHGLSGHPLYRIWRGIIERCFYEKHKAFNRYGGRGITVCEEWRNDFVAFYNWAIANGWQPGLEVDRRNNDGDYEPGNCRCVTQLINSRNKSSNRFLTHNGVTMCMSEWAEKVGIDQNTIKDRLNKLKWSVEKAITTPLNSHLCS